MWRTISHEIGHALWRRSKRILPNPGRTNRLRDSNRGLMRAAHYEGAHALTAVLLDMGLEFVSIEGYPLKSSVTRFDPGYTGNENPDDPAVREKILNNAVVSLAGIAADVEFCRMRGIRYDGVGTGDDDAGSRALIRVLPPETRETIAVDRCGLEKRAYGRSQHGPRAACRQPSLKSSLSG